jgi:MFS family permease
LVLQLVGAPFQSIRSGLFVHSHSHSEPRTIDEADHAIVAASVAAIPPALPLMTLARRSTVSHSDPGTAMGRDVENSLARPGSQAAPPSRAVSWLSLPHKHQLAIITSVRVVDFYQVASLQAFMFHQLQSFSPTAPDSDISFQTGVLQGVFTLAQIFTGVVWGGVADAPWGGRKLVLLVGLVGTGVSCVGIAFARSFAAAVAWRFLGGAINGTVGAARTALAEAVHPRYHSRAFLLLPLAFNIANIFGPILGGLLADPVHAYPSLFGPHSTFGGEHGVAWLIKYPYAAASLLSALLLFADAAWVFFGLRETQEALRYNRDPGLELAQTIKYWARRFIFRHFGYTTLNHATADHVTAGHDQPDLTSVAMVQLPPPGLARKESHPSLHPAAAATAATTTTTTTTNGPSTRTVFTNPNVLLVLLTVAIFDFQMGGFASLWLVFLSSSRRNSFDITALPFRFTGGLAFPPSTLGFAMAILGFLGIVLQFLLYPRVNARYGLLKSTRWSLLVFPIAYVLAPYLSLLVRPANPETVAGDANSNTSPSATLWFAITLVLLLQVGARTFALPGTILLINNSAPHPTMLGIVHGLGASTSSAFRTIGPIVTGYWYGIGLERGMVGFAWWALALVSVAGCLTSFWARDGSTGSF